jgi:Rod binding domain-containing protein
VASTGAGCRQGGALNINELRLTTLSGAPRTPDSPTKIRDAAQQFEALLIGQILQAARDKGGWLGSSDSSSDCAMDYAEQQLALVMARHGGLGLADLVARGLTPPESAPAPGPPDGPSTPGL